MFGVMFTHNNFYSELIMLCHVVCIVQLLYRKVIYETDASALALFVNLLYTMYIDSLNYCQIYLLTNWVGFTYMEA